MTDNPYRNLPAVIILVAAIGTLTGCKPSANKTPKTEPEVVFRDSEGRMLTTTDLQHATGTYKYEIVNGADVPPAAKQMHQMAQEAGQHGDFPKALALLEQASTLAPQWPYPVYDRAYTHLLMKDYDSAQQYYRKTLALSPRGFLTAITELDTLERESKGELPVGTYSEYLGLEWMKDPGKKLEATRQLANRVPQFAPAWKTLSDFIDDDQERLVVIERGLAAHPDPETKGVLQINKALILDRRGEHDAAVKLLSQIALDPKSTLGSEELAKFALANISKK